MRDRYGLMQSGRSNLNQDFQDFYVQSHDRIGFDHCRPHNKPVQPMIEKASQKSSMEEADRSALKAMLAARKFGPYISDIRFPHYRTLPPT